MHLYQFWKMMLLYQISLCCCLGSMTDWSPWLLCKNLLFIWQVSNILKQQSSFLVTTGGFACFLYATFRKKNAHRSDLVTLVNIFEHLMVFTKPFFLHQKTSEANDFTHLYIHVYILFLIGCISLKINM